MATLVSPGVSVSVINESFFVPASAPTVPLFFVATREEKQQVFDPSQVAAGTIEHSVVRTVTSRSQSFQLYGTPYFHSDGSGNQYHGDARNEYGLFALNQFLNVANRAYVVRANINLNDDPITFLSLGTPVVASGSQSFTGIGDGTLTAASAVSSLVRPQTISVTITTPATILNGSKFTVTGSVDGYIGEGTAGVAFVSNVVNLTVNTGSIPFAIGDTFNFVLVNDWTPSGATSVTAPVAGPNIGDGTIVALSPDVFAVAETVTVTLTSATAFDVTGTVSGAMGSGTVGTTFDNNIVNFLVSAGTTPFQAGDSFTFTVTSGVNVGDGIITNLTVDTLAIPETFTVKFTSATNFDVTGTVSGPAGSGVVGSPFDNNRLNFTVVAGTTPFAAGEEYDITIQSVTNSSPLGASDAQKRVAITTALQAAINSNTEVRSPLYEYNLIVCPGYPEVVDELLALSQSVFEEALVIADTPGNMTPDQVAQWALTSGRFSSTNAAYYYPWCLASNIDGVNVMAAPSGTALATIAYSDTVGYVWTPPAGVSRGQVVGVSQVGYFTGSAGTATQFVETNLSQGQLDNLYEYDKNINPIVFFPGRGLLVWGQKTSAPAASALDRVNVMRLVMFLRRALRKGALPFVFEPNDQLTRDNLKTAADGIMNDILIKRGLTDFASICDSSNNTPDRIDRNELWLDVAIKPTRAAEFIYIPIRVLSTAAEL